MRGIDQGGTSLTEWINDATAGRVERARRNGSIVMFDPTGAEFARWNFTNGWPKSWTFDARTDPPVIVEVVLSYDALPRA